jgi:hypothetical protein
MSEYASLVEKKREEVRNLLQDKLNKGQISIEEYSEFLERSEHLGKTLTELLFAGKTLFENSVIKDLSELFRFSVKPLSYEECFLEMKRLIEGELGSKNTYIQRTAKSLVESASQTLNLGDAPIYMLYEGIEPYYLHKRMVEIVKSIEKMMSSPSPSELRELVNKLRELQMDEEDINRLLLMIHAWAIVKKIFTWVNANIVYISDPPDDWYKPALHTLIVGGGDCDDRTILLCSLLRSIGFKTYVGFLPGHVFPGVILTKLRKVEVGKLPPEDRQKLKESGITEDYIIVTNEEVKVPLEPIEPVTVKIGDLDITLDLFNLALMDDEDLENTWKKISSLKRDYIEKLNKLHSVNAANLEITQSSWFIYVLEKLKADLETLQKAEEAIRRFVNNKNIKDIYYLD